MNIYTNYEDYKNNTIMLAKKQIASGVSLEQMLESVITNAFFNGQMYFFSRMTDGMIRLSELKKENNKNEKKHK